MNGKELNRAWFTHEELMQGGTLLLNMGPRPNKKWATDIENLPVSFNTDFHQSKIINFMNKKRFISYLFLLCFPITLLGKKA